ncbi:hypothetical protein BBJ28_00022730 [Nothophytophthora sp. Chile5]|nr:hypothetical protein BBJ28_00022730 [Nothophytophthora sp. Chile5]
MINDGNIDGAIQQTAAIDWSRGFRSVLPRPDPEPDRHLDTTHRRAFINHFPSSSPSSYAAGVTIAAGGAGGRNVERGKAASGAMGEVYKVNAEPQKDTLAQRSWMYSTDPMIVTMHKRAALAASQPETTAPREPQQASEKRESFGRKATAITAIRKHHKGVFVDDEPEQQQQQDQ